MDNTKRYKFYKDNYPDMSDEQIWTAVSLDIKSKDVVVKNGADVDINSPDIIEQIIRAAARWLEANLPKIFEKVKAYFDKLLDRLADIILQKIGDIIPYLISLF